MPLVEDAPELARSTVTVTGRGLLIRRGERADSVVEAGLVPDVAEPTVDTGPHVETTVVGAVDGDAFLPREVTTEAVGARRRSRASGCETDGARTRRCGRRAALGVCDATRRWTRGLGAVDTIFRNAGSSETGHGAGGVARGGTRNAEAVAGDDDSDDGTPPNACTDHTLGQDLVSLHESHGEPCSRRSIVEHGNADAVEPLGSTARLRVVPHDRASGERHLYPVELELRHVVRGDVDSDTRWVSSTRQPCERGQSERATHPRMVPPPSSRSRRACPYGRATRAVEDVDHPRIPALNPAEGRRPSCVVGRHPNPGTRRRDHVARLTRSLSSPPRPARRSRRSCVARRGSRSGRSPTPRSTSHPAPRARPAARAPHRRSEARVGLGLRR